MYIKISKFGIARNGIARKHVGNDAQSGVGGRLTVPDSAPAGRCFWALARKAALKFISMLSTNFIEDFVEMTPLP